MTTPTVPKPKRREFLQQWWTDRRNAKAASPSHPSLSDRWKDYRAERKTWKADRKTANAGKSKLQRFSEWRSGLTGWKRWAVILAAPLIVVALGLITLTTVFANRPDVDENKFADVGDQLLPGASQTPTAAPAPTAPAPSPTATTLPQTEQVRQAASAWAQDEIVRSQQAIDFAHYGRNAARNFGWARDEITPGREALIRSLQTLVPAAAPERPLPFGAASDTTADDLKSWLDGREWTDTWLRTQGGLTFSMGATARQVLALPDIDKVAPDIARAARHAATLAGEETVKLQSGSLKAEIAPARGLSRAPVATADQRNVIAPAPAAGYAFNRGASGAVEVRRTV